MRLHNEAKGVSASCDRFTLVAVVVHTWNTRGALETTHDSVNCRTNVRSRFNHMTRRSRVSQRGEASA